MKKIEVGKAYKTRDGREVRIYAVDGLGADAIHGALLAGERYWIPYSWDEGGSFLGSEPCDADIVIPPLKYEGEATVMGFGDGINSTIFVPSEFSGLKVKFTLEVLEPTENEKLEQLRDNLCRQRQVTNKE